MIHADLHLARRLEAVWAAGAADFARTLAGWRPEAGACVEPVGGGYAVYAGVGSPFNRAAGVGLAGPVSPADLDQIEVFYRRRRAAPAVSVCPLADRSLVEGLGARGYRIRMFLNVHVRPLGQAPPPAAAPGPPVTVVGPEAAHLWALTVSRGFAGCDDLAVPDGIADVVARRLGVTCFLARVQGLAAGGGAMSAQSGVAALFSASTRPGFRRQGVQTALLAARLAAAQDAGCDLATVETVPGSLSQRNAERAGFRVAYTRVIMAQDLADRPDWP